MLESSLAAQAVALIVGEDTKVLKNILKRKWHEEL